MEIQWLKNSTFLIKTSLGKRILIDPFNIVHSFDKNYLADIICFSKNLDSNYFSIENNLFTKIIFPKEDFYTDKVKIKSYESFSDNCNGLKRGKNYITVLEIDGFKLCHLGYIGEIPNPKIISILNDMDFIFLPIGGNVCIDGNEASNLCKLLNSKYIIPMCYKCSNEDFYYSSSKDFLTSNDFEVIINDTNILNTASLCMNKKNHIIIYNMMNHKLSI